MIEKNDYLVMLIGSSPMPNLISAFTRIKENGKIFMIYTNETEKIAKQLKELIEEKAKEKSLNILVELSYGRIYEEYNLEKVSQSIKNILNKIALEYKNENLEDKSIELNFTGGTKIMASVSYREFKEIFNNEEKAYLTYLDSEESEFVIYDISKNKTKKLPYSKENETIDLSIDDIITMHFEASGNELKNEQFKDIKISKVNEYIFETLIENYDKKEEFIKLMEEIYKFNLSNKKKASKIKENINIINEYMENSSFKIKNIDNYSSFVNIYAEEFKGLKEKDLYKLIVEDINGKWLEKVLLKKLHKLKEEGYIDDVRISEERKGKDAIFEIDLIVLKNENLYCFSVTTVDNYSEANMKLHEVNYRAKSIGGDGVKISFISFYDNGKELEEKIKNIWDDEESLNNKYLIITLENFNKIDELIKEWLR
ncbi:MAG: hypothetical protein MSA89_11230 [Clostridium sp.]|nr:hypothetical protein [Clostridium sp.]MCI7443632.1 hypothetical protein [Clostridium sp.]